VFDIRQLLDTDDKIVEGVTEKQLAASLSGPMTLDVPGGSRVLDVKIPLADPKPMTAVLAKCGEVRVLAALGATVENGLCKINAPRAGLVVDLWVEGNEMRVGKKGGAVVAEPVPMPPPAIELATGNWAMTFWGRGTMFARQDKDTPDNVDGLDPAMGTQTRVVSQLNEFGFGMKVENKDDLRFLATMRTAFANPQPVIDKLLEITGKDVLANTAHGKAAPIALEFPRSPFAGDHAAGHHGLLVPTQMLDTGVNIIVPAILMYLRGGKPPTPEAPPTPPPPGEMTAQLAKAFATKGLEIWKQKNPDKPCPPSIGHLAASVGPQIPTKDEWGNDFVLKCGKDLPAGAKDLAVISAGPDGKLDTADDIKSY
jgi:hypothetical protein